MSLGRRPGRLLRNVEPKSGDFLTCVKECILTIDEGTLYFCMNAPG